MYKTGNPNPNPNPRIPFDKIVGILQNLTALEQSHDEVPLPLFIQQLVEDTLSSFLHGIDSYLHHRRHDESEFETVTAIIEACPELLHFRDLRGNLPIHCFANDMSSSPVFLPMLVGIGHELGIGGERGRGGILDKNDAGQNVLELVSEAEHDERTVETLATLRDNNLLLVEDVQKYKLLHIPSLSKAYKTMKFLVDLDPYCMYDSHGRYDHTPICNVCDYFALLSDGESVDDHLHEEEQKNCFKSVQLLLRTAMAQNPFHGSIGGLFWKTSENDVVLDSIIGRFSNPQEAGTCIAGALSRYDNLPILHLTIRHAKHFFTDVMSSFPDSVFVRDAQNRLPIHVALEEGLEWSSHLVSLMNISRESLREVDPLTKFPPFALAGLERSCELKTIYHLLRKNPDHVEGGIKTKIIEPQTKRRKVI